MASSVSAYWQPAPEPAARVRVHDDEKLRDLLTGLPPRKQPVARTEAKAAQRRIQEAEEQRARRNERQRDEARKRQASAERLVRESLAHQQAVKEARYQALRSDIAEGHKLADEIDQHLSLQAMNRRAKLKRQFEEWNVGVYGAIQSQINAAVARDFDEAHRRRRKDFQDFLDATNTKGAIFRDIIIESEYDPLEPNRHCIKYASAHLKDPLKRVLDKHHEETSMLDTVADRPPRMPKPHVRDMLEAREWATGKIEATPHGYFAKLTDDNNPGPKHSKTFASALPLDHYDVATGPDCTNREFPVGKRTFPARQVSTHFGNVTVA